MTTQDMIGISFIVILWLICV